MIKDLLESVIDKKIELGCNDRMSALEDIRIGIEQSTPYEFAKMFGVLVEDSAEEFMVQFMGSYNFELSPIY